MISVIDLGYFVIFALLATLVIYLIITLRNINELLSEAKRIAVDNERSLQTTVENVSAITKNIDSITADINSMSTMVKHGFEKADRTIDAVEKNIKGSAESVRYNVEESIGSVRKNVEELASYIKLFTRILESFAGIFSGKRK